VILGSLAGNIGKREAVLTDGPAPAAVSFCSGVDMGAELNEFESRWFRPTDLVDLTARRDLPGCNDEPQFVGWRWNRSSSDLVLLVSHRVQDGLKLGEPCQPQGRVYWEEWTALRMTDCREITIRLTKVDVDNIMSRRASTPQSGV